MALRATSYLAPTLIPRTCNNFPQAVSAPVSVMSSRLFHETKENQYTRRDVAAPFTRRGLNNEKRQNVPLPSTPRYMSNEQISTLFALDHEGAIVEMLKRHIMSVDSVNYDDACKKFREIEETNRHGMFMHTLPYKSSIALALSSAVLSFPLCFHEPTVSWFNRNFVTADIPETKDLETWLEVGSWAWNWMEPPLGQISFFLLCLSFARAQIKKIGLRPYTDYVKEKRASRLADKYSQYDSTIIMKYSRTGNYY